MDRDNRTYEYDLNQMMIKPLYFGMFVNIMAPAALLFVCYYMTQQSAMPNRVGSMANTLYYIFGVISIVQAVGAIWWRHVRFDKPLVKRKETIESDLTEALVSNLRPIFLTIAAIAGYGILYFYLTGRFEESLFLVLLSFIAFQVVRPRMASMRKLLDRQLDYVEQGKFREES